MSNPTSAASISAAVVFPAPERETRHQISERKHKTTSELLRDGEAGGLPEGPFNTRMRFVGLEPSAFRASSQSLISFCFLALTQTCKIELGCACEQIAMTALTSLAESGELCEPDEKEDNACESLAADVTRKATGLSRCTAGEAAAAFDRALFIAMNSRQQSPAKQVERTL